MDLDKVLVGMPAYNEGPVIFDVVTNLKKEGFKNIVIVDDCSKDNTFDEAKRAGAKALRHIINRGAGGATATIIEYAKRKKYNYLVLMDSDGQHSAYDAMRLLQATKKHDIVIGSRLISDLKEMPIQRRIANFIGSIITWFVFGNYVSDSQSGFRVLNKKAIKKIKISFDQFEFCSEMIGDAFQKKLKIKEIPIKVLYSDHSLNKGHGQNIVNGFKMIARFIFR